MGKTHLAPGFRFHPTDVELVRYYLKRKVLGKKLMVDAISELDIYKFEPYDLPDMAYIKGGDLRWHFFCAREKKYSSGARINRSTVGGYWKTTGKERPVQCNSEVVGQIKTLVYHVGKSPKGERTDWVMHEYRLEDRVLRQKNIPQDTYVVCVVFKKDGPGPRNGAQYGAPFNEEDWSDDDVCTDVPAINNTPNLSEPSRETSLAVTTADESNRDCFDGLISDSCVSNALPTPTTISKLPHSSDAVITPMSAHDPNEDWFGGLISEPFVSAAPPTTTTISELPYWSDTLITPMSADDPDQDWLGGLISEPWVSNGLPTTPSISELPYPSDVANTSALQAIPMSEPLQTTPMSSALQTIPCNNEDIFSVFDLIDNDEEVLGCNSNNEIYSMLDHFHDDDEILGYSQSHFDFTAAAGVDPFGFNVPKGHGADK